MAEGSATGLSASDVLALISANSALSFVNSGQYMTLAQLMTNYPPSASYNGMYANVSNLFNGVDLSTAGGVREVVRCRQDVTNGQYNWTAQRESYNSAVASTGGTMTITPLVTPPTVRLTGTLLGNLSVGTSNTNAYIGQRVRLIQNSTLGLFATTLTGLIGSNLTLLGNAIQDLEYGVSGWFKAS